MSLSDTGYLIAASEFLRREQNYGQVTNMKSNGIIKSTARVVKA